MDSNTRVKLSYQKKKMRRDIEYKEESTEYFNRLDNLNPSETASDQDSASDSEKNSEFSYYNESDSGSSSTETLMEIEEVEEEINNTQSCEVTEVQQLVQWIVETKTPHIHVEKLLKILRQRLLPSLPSCTKTLLRNNVKINPDAMEVSDGSTGEFYHFGIKKQLEATVNPKFHETNVLELIINIDGISPFKSSKVTMWPILCKVFTQKDIYKPFTASVYAGYGKPKNASDYLEKFVNEINILQETGVIIGNRNFEVKIKYFTCDTPARSFIKNIVGHGAFKACERCRVIGEKVDQVTVFLQTNAEKKTDDDFRSFKDTDHHTGPSILSLIHPPINMLNQFILDPMHLIYLGCSNRILEFLLKSTSKHTIRLSATLKKELNRRSMEIQNDIPEEFPRKMRPTDDYNNYKAVELKFFTLYAGPFLLKKILSKEAYDHFLLFSISCRLLSKRNPHPFIQEARQRLKEFVDSAATIYGPTFISLNVHNLLYISDDVESMRCNLQEISAFAFESYLGKMTSLLRSPKHLVTQYAKRLFEIEHYCSEVAKVPENLEILVKKKNEIMKIKYQGMILSTTHPNNTVLLQNKSIAVITQFHYMDNIICIKYKNYLHKVEVIPNSNSLNIWEVNKLSSNDLFAPVTDITRKFIKFHMSYSTTEEMRQFVIPLLH